MKHSNDPFSFLYDTDASCTIHSLGKLYQPPARIESEWQLVATVSKDGDGHEVQVFECRLPAQFYKLEVHGFEVSTGSGREMGELIGKLAIEIARGMIDIRKATK